MFLWFFQFLGGFAAFMRQNGAESLSVRGEYFSCGETYADLRAEESRVSVRTPGGKYQIFVRLTRTFFTFVVAILTRKYRKKQIFYAI